jgi:hypothetical protein
MKLLETKEQLTINELLRIAYEYGNDIADMPTNRDCVEEGFNEWINGNEHLLKKLTLHGDTPHYYCKPEHLLEILGNIESMSDILSECKKDVAPEQLTLKDIYDQLKKFKD